MLWHKTWLQEFRGEKGESRTCDRKNAGETGNKGYEEPFDYTVLLAAFLACKL